MPSPIIPERTLKNSTKYVLDSLKLTALSSVIDMLTEYPKPTSIQYVELLYSIQDRKQSYLEFLMMNRFLTQEVTTKDFIT